MLSLLSRFALLVGFAAVAAVSVTMLSIPELASAAEVERCFETLDMLNGIIQETTCPFAQPQVTKLKAVPRQPIRWSPTFKSEADLRRYLECYAVTESHYDRTKQRYLPIIDFAADAFSLPRTVLACLLFRESQFSQTAVSPTGAIGLGQHLPSTMQHLTNVLKPETQSVVTKLKDIASQTVHELVSSRKVTPEQATKDKKYAETKLRVREFRVAWENYYGSIIKKDCAELYDQTKNRNKCIRARENRIERNITPEKIKADPELAIGATALYFHMILEHFNKTLKNSPKIQNGDDQSPDYYLMLAAAGSYNMGPGAAAEILKDVKPATPKNWVEALMKSNEETAAHILSIKSCIVPAASSENPWKGPIGSANYDCSIKPEYGDHVVLDKGAKNELPSKYKNKFKTASFSETKFTPPKKDDKKETKKVDKKSDKKPASETKKGRDT